MDNHSRSSFATEVKDRLLTEVVDECCASLDSAAMCHMTDQEVNNLARRICDTDRFQHWQQRLVEDCAIAIDADDQIEHLEDGGQQNRHRNGEYSSVSLTQSAFFFVGRDFLDKAAETLENSHQNDEINRQRSLQTIYALCQLPASEMAQHEDWHSLKSAISKSMLIHGIDSIDCWRGFWRLLCKFYNSNDHSLMTDALTMLGDHLRRVFAERSPTFESLIDTQIRLGSLADVLTLRKLQVLSQCLVISSKSLARFNDDQLYAVAECLIDLIGLSIGSTTDRRSLNPFQAWCLLDPYAKWWRAWLHSRSGRRSIMSSLKRRPEVVRFLYEIFESEMIGENDWFRERSRRMVTAMLTDLCVYTEIRKELMLSDRLVDGLLTSACNADVIRGNASWKQLRFLADWTSNSELFIDQGRLRRLINCLQSPIDDYRTKIETAQLLETILRKVDLSTVDRLLNIPIDDYRSVGESIADCISTIVRSASSHDPSSPLTLVHAAARLSTALCRYSIGRRSLIRRTQTADLAQLLRKKSLEIRYLMPTIACLPPDRDGGTRSATRRYLNDVAELDDRNWRNEIFWHRPIELSESFNLQFRLGLITDNIQIGDSGNEAIKVGAFWRDVSPILSRPGGWRLFITNSALMDSLLSPINRQSTSGEDQYPHQQLLLHVLSTFLCQADFLVAVRHRYDVRKRIINLLTAEIQSDSFRSANDQSQNRTQDDSESGDRSSNLRAHSAISAQMARILFKLEALGGYRERWKYFETNWADDQYFRPQSSEIRQLLLRARTFSPKPSSQSVRTTDRSSADFQPLTSDQSAISHVIESLRSGKPIDYADLILKAIRCQEMTPFRIDDDDSGTKPDPYPIEMILYDLILEYGQNLRLLDASEASTGLSILLTNCRPFQPVDHMASVDWFASIIFFVFSGDHRRSFGFLSSLRMHNTKLAECIWPRLLGPIAHAVLLTENIGNLLDRMLETELPRVIALLTMHGLTANNMMILWINQCFINILDWPEICNYVVLSVAGGPVYQALFCCCVFHQFSDELLRRANSFKSGDLYRVLVSPIKFKFIRSLEFLLYLQNKYC